MTPQAKPFIVRIVSKRALVPLFLVLGVSVVGGIATAQITEPRILSSELDRFANLQEQLVNRLRATTPDQREYIELVVKKARMGTLDLKLIVAVERYALRRSPNFAFPFFERALRFEAAKREIALISFKEFVALRGAESAF